MNSRLLVNISFAATIVPLYILYYIWSITIGSNTTPDFEFLFNAQTLIGIYSFSLMAFYIVYLAKLKSISTELKLLWAVVIFVTNVLAMLVVWYLYIYKPYKNGGTVKYS